MDPANTWVFSYPIEAPEKAMLRNNLSALQHLHLWLTYAEHWCEHKPSITVSVRDDEWLEVGAFVYKNFDRMSGISFLPYSDHVYQQAPYQEVTEEEWQGLAERTPSALDWSRLSEFELEDNTTATHELACTAGFCEVQ
jgi:ribonucleoside-diphosphate reductase alpha chain